MRYALLPIPSHGKHWACRQHYHSKAGVGGTRQRTTAHDS
jgi:hypothetical protein